MKKCLSLLIITMMCSVLSYGQDSALDRIYQDKIGSLSNLGKDLMSKNEKETAIEYFIEAIETAENRSHDCFAGNMVLDIMEPVIDWYYNLDSLERARHFIGLYERFQDSIETELKKTGYISRDDYCNDMLICYNYLSAVSSEHCDYETSIEYGEKYISTAKIKGVFNEEYLDCHKTLVADQIYTRRFEDALSNAVEIYYESKKLGHTDEDALQMAHSVHYLAMNDGGLYWFVDDVTSLSKFNTQWINFVESLRNSIGESAADSALMKLDQKNSLYAELADDITSSTLLASYFTKVCLTLKTSGYDKAKKDLLELKSFAAFRENPLLWQRASLSFLEILQSIQPEAVYGFCKLVEPYFSDKSEAILDDYVTFYLYYWGACDRVANLGKAMEIFYDRFCDDGLKLSSTYWRVVSFKSHFFISYLGNFDEGLRSALEALHWYRLPNSPQTGDYIAYAGLLDDVGAAYRRKGDNENAVVYYNKALNICNENNLQDQALYPLYDLGRLYHSQKNYDEARKCFISCVDILSRSSNPNINSRLSGPYSYLFDIERRGGNVKMAREYLSQMWKCSLDEYSSYQDYVTANDRALYWQKTCSIDFIGGLVAESAPDYNDIYYNMLLVSKGFILRSETEEYQNVISSGDDKLLSMYKSIHSDKGVSQSLIDEYMTLYRSYGFISHLTTPTWKDVQGALGRNDVAIEFFRYQIDDLNKNPQYGALLIKRRWKTPRFVHLCSEKELNRAMSDVKVSDHCKQLYPIIWEPLQRELDGVKNVYFSPYGILHAVNLSAFENDEGEPLADSYSFHRVSSTYNICKFHDATLSDGTFSTSHLYGGLIYDSDEETMLTEHRKYSSSSRGLEWEIDTTARTGWDYLPDSELEIKEVAKYMKAADVAVTEYSGTSGTEESFKSLSGKHPGHIHLATHGFYISFSSAQDTAAVAENLEKKFVSSLPSLTRSGLILSNGGRAWKGESIPDGIEDGILQANEIVGLDLSGTSLLVLSACQTALGDVSGDGIYGLQRAFKIAGVDTIVMSLWNIDDNVTLKFMSLFYRLLSKGMDKHSAFRDAQILLRRQYPNPYYWASFIMLD